LLHRLRQGGSGAGSDAGSDAVGRCRLLHRLRQGGSGAGSDAVERCRLLHRLRQSGSGAGLDAVGRCRLLHRLCQGGNGTGRLARHPPRLLAPRPDSQRVSKRSRVSFTSTRDTNRHLLPRRRQGRRSVKATAQFSRPRATSPQASASNTRRGKKRLLRSNIAGMPARANDPIIHQRMWRSKMYYMKPSAAIPTACHV
jgi:hypothetical protein